MKLYHVVAMSNRRVIGKENKLPWHFSADLKYFKELTTGSTVIMGRKTYESIGRPLPNRENYVLSRGELKSGQEHLKFFQSIDQAIIAVNTEKAFIIGGSTIYEQTLTKVAGIYVTRIHADFVGDAFYPEIPKKFILCKKTNLQNEPLIEALYFSCERIFKKQSL